MDDQTSESRSPGAPPPGGGLGLGLAVSASLAALGQTLDDRDLGAVRLARALAEAADADPSVLDKVAPRLLAVLESLGLTPASRARMGEGSGPVGDDPLARFLAGAAK